MAAYRELENGAVETIELDVHLEGCASCRQELACQMFIGEQLGSLPVVEPPPDMHPKLMRALAKEHLFKPDCRIFYRRNWPTSYHSS